ncbi:phage tail protein [Limnobaculum zhutongyuii]|uniref:Phage tail protein n=1 Tax=Limnobaculum zhutongyuii TaxID=2498113 RepID=A0A411WMA9_9GAMM|nr:phage tail protein [Limnobaculum zhutongyuii]TQS86098.1 phage tail protein [Limnobaculum zhutongyuii]
MNAWTGIKGSRSWKRFPDGTIIQRGISIAGTAGNPTTIQLPISFSDTNYSVVCSYDNARSGISTIYSFAALPLTASTFALMGSLTSGSIYAYWIAIGE